MNATVVLFWAPVTLGMTIGFLLGGRISAVAKTRMRWIWLLWVAALVEIIDPDFGMPKIVVIFGVVAAWLAVNLFSGPDRLRVRPMNQIGLATILLGLGANGLVMGANGRMPYSVDAAGISGIAPGTTSSRNMPETVGSRWTWLGDNIPIPPFNAVVSIGDIAIALGIVVLVPALMAVQPSKAQSRERR